MAVHPVTHLEDARVLAVNSRWLALHKPAWLPTLAPEASLGDAHRLALDWLERNEEERGYLGQLEPLDRDASGVLLFSRDRSGNAALLRGLEGAKRSWCVRVDASHLPRALGRLRARAGLPEVVLRRGNDVDGDALLELELRGGSKVVRGWLSALHLEPRSPLHLRALELAQPALRVEAPLPWTHREPARLAPWTREALGERLREACLRRSAALAQGTTAARLAHRAAEGLPGIAVDLYDQWALVHLYENLEGPERESLYDAVASLGVRGVYVRFRPKQASVLGDTRREDVAPAAPVRGEAAPEEFEVRERGLRYRVRLADGMSTGLFLDQRENRERVRELCARGGAARVLNLFAYTAPFTVAAAAGGARTVSVDVSAPALGRAKSNLEANEAWDPERHLLVQADVFGWLQGSRARGERYELVVLDPPSFSTVRSGARFSAESDYGALLDAALGVLAPGGRVMACCNHTGVSKGRLRRVALAAAERAGRKVLSLRELADPVDFPAEPGHECHLKALLLELA